MFSIEDECMKKLNLDATAHTNVGLQLLLRSTKETAKYFSVTGPKTI